MVNPIEWGISTFRSRTQKKKRCQSVISGIRISSPVLILKNGAPANPSDDPITLGAESATPVTTRPILTPVTPATIASTSNPPTTPVVTVLEPPGESRILARPRRGSLFIHLASKNNSAEARRSVSQPLPVATPVNERASSIKSPQTPINRTVTPNHRSVTPRNAGEASLVKVIESMRRVTKSPSLAAIELPRIPHVGKITMSDLLGEDAKNRVPNGLLPGRLNRKPVPNRSDSVSDTSSSRRTAPRFNPQEPRTNPNMHMAAKIALTRRYQSKIPLGFEVPGNLTARAYDFRWVEKHELDKKVLEDIIWVRERYSQAGEVEPSDKEIIHWYDAEVFDESEERNSVMSI